MRHPQLVTRRSLVGGVAIACVAALALPAGATTTTTTTTPSHGSAMSSLTVIRLKLAGQTVTAGQIDAVVSNAHSPHTVQLVVTPLDSTATGPVGQQPVTPGSPATTVPSTPKSLTLPGGLGSITGPTFAVQAKDGSTLLAAANLTALGDINLTTLPLTISLNAAALSDMAKVGSASASGVKSFSLGNLSLPSVAALLSAVGVDLPALLDEMTQGNLTKLAGVVTDTTAGAIATANTAVDTIQGQLTAAGQTPADSVAQAQDDAVTAQTAADSANQAFSDAWSTAYNALPALAKTTIDTALGALLPPLSASTLTADQFANLDSTTAATVKAVFDAVDTTIWTNLSSLADAAVAAEAVVTLVNQLVDALQALVQAVLDAVNNNTDPIAGLGGISVVTKAVAAKMPTANASVQVASVDVLGVATALSSLTNTLAAQLQPLTQAINSVAGVTFTPPHIAVGAPSHGTSRSGQTRHAFARVSAVTVTLPTITLPAALQLPGAPTTVSGSLALGVLGESAGFTPAVSHTVTSPTPGAGGGPSLSETGGRVGVPILAVVLIAAAAVLRRRWGHA